MKKQFEKIKLFYYRTFKVISKKKAQELGLRFIHNLYGFDAINKLNCRSLWRDKNHNIYRVADLITDKKEDLRHLLTYGGFKK
jgi:hypothetical protein